MAYSRASLSTFTIAFTLLMIVGTFFQVIAFFGWLIFVIIALPLNIDDVRKQYISGPLLAIFRGIMPEMSKTEQEAIDAGTTWFEAELF
ncbi:MAG: acyl-CoA dehydrogenase, partial [Colwellia sp.]